MNPFRLAIGLILMSSLTLHVFADTNKEFECLHPIKTRFCTGAGWILDPGLRKFCEATIANQVVVDFFTTNELSFDSPVTTCLSYDRQAQLIKTVMRKGPPAGLDTLYCPIVIRVEKSTKQISFDDRFSNCGAVSDY